MAEENKVAVEVDGAEGVSGVATVEVYAPPNSLASKKAEESTTEVTKKDPEKPSLFAGFGRELLQEILLPGAKNFAYELLKTLTDMMLGRVSDKIFDGKKPEGNGFIKYNRSKTTSPSGIGNNAANSSVVSKRTIGDKIELVLNDEKKANDALVYLFDELDRAGEVAASKLFSYLDIVPPYTYSHWGWKNLNGSAVRQVREGWFLDLPPVRPI